MEQIHPGLHPDPAVLSAFVEDVLPEHERRECLSHLAECSRCREIVLLAQPQVVPEAVGVVESTGSGRRWATRIPYYGSGLAAACALVMAVFVFRQKPKEPTPAADIVSQSPAPTRSTVQSAPVGSKNSQPQQSMLARARKAKAGPGGHAPAALSQVDLQPELEQARKRELEAMGRMVNERPGGFLPIAPAAQGVERSLSEDRGSIAARAVEMISGSISMPNQPPAAITATSGSRMLAVDAAGALFFRNSAARRWQRVKVPWQGKAARLVTLAETPPVFRLTTDSGAVWLSRDGLYWFPSDSPH